MWTGEVYSRWTRWIPTGANEARVAQATGLTHTQLAAAHHATRWSGYVYFMEHDGLTKIGYSCYLHRRLVDFLVRYPGIVMAHAIATNAMRYLELVIHWRFRHCHVQDQVHDGEEWFQLPPAMMDEICLVKRYRFKPEAIVWYDLRNGQVLPWRHARTLLAHRVLQRRIPPPDERTEGS
jgi:hypothetical protein